MSETKLFNVQNNFKNHIISSFNDENWNKFASDIAINRCHFLLYCRDLQMLTIFNPVCAALFWLGRANLELKAANIARNKSLYEWNESTNRGLTYFVKPNLLENQQCCCLKLYQILLWYIIRMPARCITSWKKHCNPET